MSDEAALGGGSNADVLVKDRTVVEIRRSGGMVGRTITFGVDSGELAPAQAARLEDLVEQSSADDASDSPDAPEGRARGADRFQYDLAISTGSQQRHFRFTEGSAAYARFRDLIAFAVDAARAGRETEGKDH